MITSTEGSFWNQPVAPDYPGFPRRIFIFLLTVW